MAREGLAISRYARKLALRPRSTSGLSVCNYLSHTCRATCQPSISKLYIYVLRREREREERDVYTVVMVLETGHVTVTCVIGGRRSRFDSCWVWLILLHLIRLC